MALGRSLLVSCVILSAACGSDGNLRIAPYDPEDGIAPVTTADPPGATLRELPALITLSTDEPAAIRFTLDGSDPAMSTAEESPVVIAGLTTSTVLRFFAVDPAGNEESVRTESYLLDLAAPAAITAFKAAAASSSVSLSWTNPVEPDFAGVLVARSTGALWSPVDGESYEVGASLGGDTEILFLGVAEVFAESDLKPSWNRYGAWAFDGLHNYSRIAVQSANLPLPPQIATVTVNVAAVNDAPVGVANSYVTPVNTSLTVPAATGVLANDTDTEGDPLTAVVVAQPAHGTLTLNVDGSLFFVPTTGYIGLDSFTYRASDGALQSAITTVNLQIGIDPKVVIINEIMYHPASNNDLEEYIELYNSGTGPMDMTGWQFTKGVDFIFPSVTIPAGGYLVVAANVAAFNAAYGSVPLIVGGWTGSLANSGETIRLQFPDSTAQDGLSEVDKVDYSKEGDWGLRRAFTDTETGWEWQTRSDGFGDSLELINPALTNSNGQNWTRREVAAAGNQRT